MRTRLFKKVVGSIVILFNSLSAMALTELLAVSAGEMNGTLQPMHSVLDISDDLDSPIRVFGHKIFSRGPSMWLSQHRRSAQALIGLGTGRSPSSSGCSPSAQALLSRAQSRSSTLSSAPIMHFLTRPSCRGRLVKFRPRFSGCEVVENLKYVRPRFRCRTSCTALALFSQHRILRPSPLSTHPLCLPNKLGKEREAIYLMLSTSQLSRLCKSS
jgi:hypothetical protein